MNAVWVAGNMWFDSSFIVVHLSSICFNLVHINKGEKIWRSVLSTSRVNCIKKSDLHVTRKVTALRSENNIFFIFSFFLHLLFSRLCIGSMVSSDFKHSFHLFQCLPLCRLILVLDTLSAKHLSKLFIQLHLCSFFSSFFSFLIFTVLIRHSVL